MPPFASGSRVRLTYIKELVRGVTPTTGPGTMTTLRVNGSDLDPERGTLRSEEVRPDRQTVTMRLSQKSVSGDIPGEIMLGNHDDFIESALAGTWAPVTAANDIGITNPDQLVCSGATLLTDGFRAGDIVRIAGLAVGGEDGRYRFSAVAAAVATLVNLDGTAAVLTTEAENATPTLDLEGERCDVGTTLSSFSIERGFEDISEFQMYRGMAINTMDWTIQPDSIPGISYGMLGMGFDDWVQVSADSAPIAAPTFEGVSPFDGRMWEGAVPTAILTGLDFQVNNNRELDEVIGALESPDIFEGDSVVTGTATMLFKNSAALSKFVTETETSLWGRLRDPSDADGFLAFVMNRVKFTGATPAAPRTGPVIITMPFEALLPAGQTVISIQKSNL